MAASILNLNVGVLGHVDSGKTSLAKAVSTIASTASFDKNPQSQERGITIDLGFSSFQVSAPEHIRSSYEHLQFTLVDCPGHASLIKTIIGGAQIIDMMMLVIDITKGIQTQTAECLVIGEITCDHMLLVLNKVDLLPESKRAESVEKMTKKLRKTLEKTKFANSAIVSVAAKPGGGAEDGGIKEPMGLTHLLDALAKAAYIPERQPQGPLVLSVDHCFSIRGQGTVLTGTVLEGSVSLNDVIEIPSLRVTKKVKSIQVFRKPVNKAIQGDRVGVCVTQLEAGLLERGVVCSPGHLGPTLSVLASVSGIGHFKGPCLSGAKFHVTFLHTTIMAKATFLSRPAGKPEEDLRWDAELLGHKQEAAEEPARETLVLLELEQAAILGPNMLLIGSKLDMDAQGRACRLAFHGRVLRCFTDTRQRGAFADLPVYKRKSRAGVVDRMLGESELVVRSLFKKDTDLASFEGLWVRLDTGERGTLGGPFGQSGKVRVSLRDEPSERLRSQFPPVGRGKKAQAPQGDHPPEERSPIAVTLEFKKYIFDPKKKIVQGKLAAHQPLSAPEP
ncbi:selenocysteine-specific elongation factor [Ixodes scapularis]